MYLKVDWSAYKNYKVNCQDNIKIWVGHCLNLNKRLNND